jgi:hypothetical protein
MRAESSTVNRYHRIITNAPVNNNSNNSQGSTSGDKGPAMQLLKSNSHQLVLLTTAPLAGRLSRRHHLVALLPLGSFRPTAPSTGPLLLLLLLFRLQQPKGEGIETRTSKAGSSRQEIPLLVQMHHRAIGKWARLAAEQETVSAVLNSTRQLRLWGQLTAEINEGGNQQQPNERGREGEREMRA